MRLLSLFDGTGSISKPFAEAGWEVQSLDIDGRHGATLVQDIRTWDYAQEPCPNVISAAPPCEAYSCANTRGRRNLELADSLVRKASEIIQHFELQNPDLLWFIENPDSSLLWRRPVGTCLTPQIRLDHCAYGRLWRKRTRLATNSGYVPRPLCDPKTCHACVGKKHIRTAQRGPQRGCSKETCSLDELHAYPKELCDDILAHCLRQMWQLV
jgi:hypothetical protein